MSNLWRMLALTTVAAMTVTRAPEGRRGADVATVALTPDGRAEPQSLAEMEEPAHGESPIDISKALASQELLICLSGKCEEVKEDEVKEESASGSLYNAVAGHAQAWVGHAQTIAGHAHSWWDGGESKAGTESKGDGGKEETAAPRKVGPVGVAVNGNYQWTADDTPITATAGDREYKLAQWHVHFPPEHVTPACGASGNCAGEVHFVFASGGKVHAVQNLVVGLLLNETKPAPVGSVEDPDMAASMQAALALPEVERLLAEAAPNGAFHYHGGLTTPPFTTIVEWYVLKDPVAVTLRKKPSPGTGPVAGKGTGTKRDPQPYSEDAHGLVATVPVAVK